VAAVPIASQTRIKKKYLMMEVGSVSETLYLKNSRL
jgi:hypothetical protein